MKRSTIIRRRRRIIRTVALAFAFAAVGPTSAFASYVVDRPDGGFDRYLAAPVAAADLDAHGRFVAATATQQAATSVYKRADDFAPPRTVSGPSGSVSTTDWSRIALGSSLAFAGLLGLFVLGLATRRGPRVAHS